MRLDPNFFPRTPRPCYPPWMARKMRTRPLAVRHRSYARRPLPLPAPGADPGAALRAAEAALRARGYRLVPKVPVQRPSWLARWMRYATTLPGLAHDAADLIADAGVIAPVEIPELVLLDSDWSDKTELSKALTLRHELGHVLQVEAMGSLLFALRYTTPRWRWAIEINVYRHELMDLRAFGVSARARQRVADARVRSLSESYLLRHVRNVEQETADVLDAVV